MTKPMSSNLARNPTESTNSTNEVVITRDGQHVYTDGTVWTLRQRRESGSWLKIDLGTSAFIDAFDESLLDTIRAYLSFRLTTRSPSTVVNDNRALWRFARHLVAFDGAPLGPSDLREHHFVQFLHQDLTKPSIRGVDFCRIRLFVRWASYRELVTFEPGLEAKLNGYRVPGNEKGRAVRTADPDQGALAKSEIHAITSGLRSGKAPPLAQLVTRLCLETGANPISLALLRVEHLVRLPSSDETILMLPLGKKRHGATPRQPRQISPMLADELATACGSRGEKEPMLPELSRARDISGKVTVLLKAFVRTNSIRSAHADRPLWLTARRFRRTLASDVAATSGSLYSVAAILGHADTQNAGVYIDSRSVPADTIARRLDPVLKPIATLFRGNIVDPAEAAGMSVVPGVESSIRLDVGGIGGCSVDPLLDGVCALTPPLSCYTCPKFSAFRDGPHEQVLRSLDSAMQELEASGNRRLSHQLKDVRNAVAELATMTPPSRKGLE